MMIIGAAVLLALAAPSAQAEPPATAPTIPPATLDESLEIDGESVAARQLRTRLSIPVMVNGQGPLRFVVDSGADRSVIGLAAAERLGLPKGKRVMLHGVAGAMPVDTVTIDTLTIGTSEIYDITAPQLPEGFIGAQGIIGIDALAEQRLMLDFDKKAISVQDSRRPVAVESDVIVVTARLRHGQLILTQAIAGNDRLYAIIDTGSEVTMGNSALLKKIFRGRNPPPATPVTLTSVTGQTVTASLIVIPHIRIGGLTLGNVPVAFADVPPFKLFGLATQPAMLLGTDLLENFRRVSLDFRNRKVRFQLRR
jgi:predicted aspartyl protease